MDRAPRKTAIAGGKKMNVIKSRVLHIAGLFKATSVIALGIWAGTALAQENAIEKVTANQAGSAVTLTIQMKAPLKDAPANFSVTNPSRIALDFPGTTNALGKSLVDIAQGDLRSVNVVQAGDRSRVVLNLLKNVPYSVANAGSTVTITLNSAPAVTFASTAAAATAAPASNTTTATASRSGGRDLRSIDFRKGNEGEGRVVIDLPDSQTPVDIRQQGQTVVVDFLRTTLPENLRRQFDASDFGTPVQRFRTFANGENVRMVIEPRGLWEHSAYQSDTQLVIDVRPIKEDPNKLIQGTRQGYKGERLSLNFQNVDVRSLLQVIADFTNLNIITSETVQGNITLRLKDVPWDQALDIILQTKNLDMRKNGNVILVAPKDELATKEKLELEQKSQIADLEPIRSEVFQLSYQRAEEVKKLIGDSGGSSGGSGGTTSRILSKRGSAAADMRTNQLFVQDTPSKLDEIRRFIARVDIPVKQVMIEARIVEADDRFGRNLGVKLGFNDRRSTVQDLNGNPVYSPYNGQGGSANALISGNLQGVQDLSSQNGAASGGATTTALGLGRSSVGNTNFVNFPAAAVSGSAASPAAIALSIFGSSLTRFINLELSALEADRKGKIVSSPRVVTADQIKATIEQGTEYPYQQATSSGATSISFRKAVLKLEVTPQITPEGGIILDLIVNKDSRGETTANGPAIDTKNITTRVLVDNGGTVVIGGIYQIEERNQVSKVPLLGDIPYVGALFRSTERVNDKTELLVFISPKVISERLTSER
jgi:type IV pilus assembly protein PilQ